MQKLFLFISALYLTGSSAFALDAFEEYMNMETKCIMRDRFNANGTNHFIMSDHGFEALDDAGFFERTTPANRLSTLQAWDYDAQAKTEITNVETQYTSPWYESILLEDCIPDDSDGSDTGTLMALCQQKKPPVIKPKTISEMSTEYKQSIDQWYDFFYAAHTLASQNAANGGIQRHLDGSFYRKEYWPTVYKDALYNYVWPDLKPLRHKPYFTKTERDRLKAISLAATWFDTAGLSDNTLEFASLIFAPENALLGPVLKVMGKLAGKAFQYLGKTPIVKGFSKLRASANNVFYDLLPQNYTFLTQPISINAITAYGKSLLSKKLDAAVRKDLMTQTAEIMERIFNDDFFVYSMIKQSQFAQMPADIALGRVKLYMEDILTKTLIGNPKQIRQFLLDIGIQPNKINSGVSGGSVLGTAHMFLNEQPLLKVIPKNSAGRATVPPTSLFDTTLHEVLHKMGAQNGYNGVYDGFIYSNKYKRSIAPFEEGIVEMLRRRHMMRWNMLPKPTAYVDECKFAEEALVDAVRRAMDEDVITHPSGSAWRAVEDHYAGIGIKKLFDQKLKQGVNDPSILTEINHNFGGSLHAYVLDLYRMDPVHAWEFMYIFLF